MEWVRDKTRYNTETATEIFSTRVDDQYFGVMLPTLYRSPGGRFFAVLSDEMDLFEDTDDICAWLQKYDAPAEAYIEVGIELVDG